MQSPEFDEIDNLDPEAQLRSNLFYVIEGLAEKAILFGKGEKGPFVFEGRVTPEITDLARKKASYYASKVVEGALINVDDSDFEAFTRRQIEQLLVTIPKPLVERDRLSIKRIKSFRRLRSY